MAKVDQRVAQEINIYGFRHLVMAAYPAEVTISIPEQNSLGSWLYKRARGLCVTLHVPFGSSAEDPDDRYLGEDITINEFAHYMYLLGLI